MLYLTEDQSHSLSAVEDSLLLLTTLLPKKRTWFWSRPMSKVRDWIRRWASRSLGVAVVVAVILGVVYRERFAPISAVPHVVVRGEIVADVMGTGTLEAHVKATVSSRISGRIHQVLVDQGDRVTQGQLLVHLDDEELQQQVAIAVANREAAEAAIDRLKADRKRAIAIFEQARKNHDRVETLVAKQATSEGDLDRASESLAVARAELSRAEAGITEGQQELIAAEKTLQYHRARLADTAIKAPIDGLIVRRQRDPGDVVVPGSSILTLISTNELWITAWVDETEMDRLKQAQPARVVFRSEPRHTYPGSVVRLGREADRETREFIVDVRVLRLPEHWAVGQRAEVYIERDRKSSAVLLPARYLVRRDDQTGVFVNQDGYTKWRTPILGLRSTETVEVVEGIEPGETVVIPSDPRNSLREGQRVVTP